jgi:hypothetical protein
VTQLASLRFYEWTPERVVVGGLYDKIAFGVVTPISRGIFAAIAIRGGPITDIMM